MRIDATVCLDEGILEYLVCRPGTFEHETVFTTRCQPAKLHVALLAIGLVPHPFRPEGFGWWATARQKPRSRVVIEVEWEHEGTTVRRPVGTFLTNRERPDGVAATHWIFTGSAFFKHEGKNHYAADHTGVTIGIIPEGCGVVQFGERAGIPYQGEDQGLEINTETVPRVGTKVKLIFTPHRKGADEAE